MRYRKDLITFTINLIYCLSPANKKKFNKDRLGFITSESNSKAVCIATILSFCFLIEDVRFFIEACNAWQRKE